MSSDPDGSERPDRHPRGGRPGHRHPISARVDEVRVDAARATIDAAAAHDAAAAAAEDEASIAECGLRFDELGAGIAHSEKLKTAALELEAVIVDGVLSRMLEPDADIAAMQVELRAHDMFGYSPLAPVEPSTLSVFVPETGVAVLCSARGVGAGGIAVSSPTGTWLASDSARVRIALRGDQPPPSCAAELRMTLLALASRVRVTAALVPVEGGAAVGPLLLAFECGLNGAGDGICVTISVPDTRPLVAAAWVLCVGRLSLCGSLLPPGTLAAGVLVFFRHHHSAVCNHLSAPMTAAEVYNSAWTGDIPCLVRALANGGSTCEKNGVRITRGDCLASVCFALAASSRAA